MKRIVKVIALAMLVGGCGGGGPITSMVDSVPSGDLIVLRSGERLRLAHIEAPLEGADGFDQAQKDLERIVKDKKISISRVGQDADGSIIAEIMVQGISISKIMQILGSVQAKERRPVAQRR